MPNWQQQWEVPSSSGRGAYTVSFDGAGGWACSCRGWTMHTPRKDCRHILEKKLEVSEQERYAQRLETKAAAAIPQRARPKPKRNPRPKPQEPAALNADRVITFDNDAA